MFKASNFSGVKFRFAALAILIGVGLVACDQTTESTEMSLESQDQRISYGIALNMGRRMKAEGVPLDADAFARGIRDAISGAEAQMTDEEAIVEITALRGFGRWSAEIYLMFSLNRQDIFPADDLALLVALGRLKKLSDKPTPKQARDLIAHWAPYRSVGSLFLWHYYRGAPA